MTDDEDLDGSQLPEIHVEIEVTVDAPNLGFEKVIELRILQPRDMNGSHFRQRDRAGAIHNKRAALVDLAPDLKADLIPGTNHIVGRDWDIVDRGKGRWRLVEERRAENGQCAACASRNHLLELRELDRRD